MSVALPRPVTVRTALRSPRLLRTEVLGGLVVALALIPEAISFSVIAHICDTSTVAALDAVTTKYRRHGITVDVRGLNEASEAMYERLSGHLSAHG